ncbi:DNA methylase [Kineococcus sp. LSe6-4]|uniref:DNA methylase n=1 Tax=Kineococcus halophytocola TaxID=3234027 RepID=A0ABV4H1L6_9ACTN
MAEAPGHRLGQIIGEALELALEPVLSDFAKANDLYLDKYGKRSTREGPKVTWYDDKNNKHDLDFVLERGGSDTKVGVPVAFIESAWRRYTKHSKNKAQEIQGAVEPLIRKHSSVKPFGGAIVGGMWSKPSLTQLTSLGFGVCHIEYSEIVHAFRQVGMEVATSEATHDSELQKEVDKYDALSASQKFKLGEELRKCAPEEFKKFRMALERAIIRKLDRVLLIAMHGVSGNYASIAEAVNAIRTYEPPAAVPEVTRWEVSMRFTNEDRIDASFQDKELAIDFMESFASK